MKYIAKYCNQKEFRHVKVDILLMILNNYLEVVSCEFEPPGQARCIDITLCDKVCQ